MKSRFTRKWYLTAIAATYFVLCTASCVRYASLLFRDSGAVVPLATQLICLGMAVAAATYFFRPMVGHLALLFLTSISIIAIGLSDPKATGFHLCVLLFLLVPVVESRRTKLIVNQRM